MTINIPTQVFFYVAGIIGVVVVVVLVAGSISVVDRYFSKKRIEKAAREE